MSNKRPYEEVEGGSIYSSKFNNKPPSMKPVYTIREFDPSEHYVSSNQDAAGYQNGETSQAENEITNARHDRSAEEERTKKGDVQLAGTPPNKENGNDSTGPNTIIYVQMTSRI